MGLWYLYEAISIDKLEAMSIKYKFMGYLKEIRRYYFYDPSEQKIFISRNAIFLEEEFHLRKYTRSIMKFDEVPKLSNDI